MSQMGGFVASRRALLSAVAGEVPEADGDLLHAGAVVAAGDRSSILLARAGDLRRIDLWVAAAGLVLHGFDDDESAPVPGSFHEGRSAAVVGLTQLVAPYLGAGSGPIPDEPQVETAPSDLRELLEVVVRSGSGPHDGVSAVVLTRLDDPEAVTQVVVLKDAVLRWCEAGLGESIDLRTGGLAELWGLLLGVLDPIPGFVLLT
jgi:hypothetical protein